MENLKDFKEEVTREIIWNGSHGMTVCFSAEMTEDPYLLLDPYHDVEGEEWLKAVDVHADEDGSPDQAVDRFIKKLRDDGLEFANVDVWDENTRRSYFSGVVRID